MGLNKSKGNMYPFITDTWNVIKGKCWHDCKYCYMKKFGEQKPIRFDKSELKTDMGKGKFIFVGSGCDMWAPGISDEWIEFILWHCKEYPDNKYFFQSKNPIRFERFIKTNDMPKNFHLCTTIETDLLWFPGMGNACNGHVRAKVMRQLSEKYSTKNYITIEPIIEFESAYEFAKMIKKCNPIQVNIGADSCGHELPEPSAEKINSLIKKLSSFTKVLQKKNLNRLLR